jgi:SlyX protein
MAVGRQLTGILIRGKARLFHSVARSMASWRSKKREAAPKSSLEWPPSRGQSPYFQSHLMNEERLINIEAKITFQEDLIEELNKTVYQQQQKLDRLEAICEALARHIQSLAEEGNESKPANERPPHY